MNAANQAIEQTMFIHHTFWNQIGRPVDNWAIDLKIFKACFFEYHQVTHLFQAKHWQNMAKSSGGIKKFLKKSPLFTQNLLNLIKYR